MDEMQIYSTSDTLKGAINSLIKSVRKNPEKGLVKEKSIKDLRLDKKVPFIFFLDLETRTVDFVIDQILVKETRYGEYSSLPYGRYDNLHNDLIEQLHMYESSMIVNDDDSLAKLFGFRDDKQRKLAIFKKEDRKNQKRLREFISLNELKPSYSLNFFKAEAEFANYMMTYVTSSPIWKNEDINLQYGDFDIVPKLMSIIRDFCQLDLMKSKVKDWDENPLIKNKSNSDQKERIESIRASVEQSYRLRYASLVVLQDAFDKFVHMEEELQNVVDLMDFEYDLQTLEDRTMDLQAQKDTLIRDVQEVYLSGQAFESIAQSVNATIDDILELETSIKE